MKRLFHRASPSWLPILPILTLLALLSACGGSASAPPPVPTGLTAVGSLGEITLSWTSGGPVVGHNIYRSTDNVTFVKLNGAKVGGTSYIDNIASPAGDGIFYYYRITAVDTAESAPSATGRAIHGTRLAPAYLAGFSSDNTLSPYVLEGTTVVDNGSFVIGYGSKLYILDNAVLDVAKGRGVTVNGLLRVLAASGASHATITSSPRVGAPLVNGEGFSITFFGADDFNPTDNSGTWLRNTLISNLMSSQAVLIQSCSPGFENCKLAANDNIGTSYFDIYAGAGPSIRNCSFNHMTLELVAPLGGDFLATTLAIDNNIFSNSYYAISFMNMVGPGVSAGQIANNEFDGRNSAYLFHVTGANVPLINNYWNGGAAVPTVSAGGFTTVTYTFFPTLTTAPSPVGPDW